ncbi:A/G-specific adenine glycosylase [Wenzhouxiangella sp. EGI_FJ10409]|uniref:A/G-specific adenine glycosylase n=1 Tax=Wenzhouxiangella sp. EGI_FJ10409 TaxID=3243767 RepID=UPI0035DC0974
MIDSAPDSDFATRLLTWWSTHGRHDLPWQQNRTPYRVWVAEIMLQQTQVATVIPYFERFMAAFPDLESLAHAEIDDVLSRWSGLGYYARARNLHAAAQRCMSEHQGALPDDAEAMEALPGIGRSTANAIVAQAHDRRAVILDGNVKRVLARHAGIEGWPGRSAVLRQLWNEAEDRTPEDRAADYTQAIMDLGATLCTPRRPDCEHCPVSADCIARKQGRVGELPTPKPRKEKPHRSATLLIIENERGEILMQRRPGAGIWGGLWSLPESGEATLSEPAEIRPPPAPVRHQFTHFTLEIRFERTLIGVSTAIEEAADRAWMQRDEALDRGLPQPVRKVLERLD